VSNDAGHLPPVLGPHRRRSPGSTRSSSNPDRCCSTASAAGKARERRILRDPRPLQAQPARPSSVSWGARLLWGIVLFVVLCVYAEGRLSAWRWPKIT